jgi:hypothetical protein
MTMSLSLLMVEYDIVDVSINHVNDVYITSFKSVNNNNAVVVHCVDGVSLTLRA